MGVRIFRLTLGALGLAALAYGAYGLLSEPPSYDQPNVGEWLVVGLIGHDFLLAPIVYVLGAIAYRFTSARWRGRLAALLLIGGSLFLVSVPALLQQGTNVNPTVLPLDYTRNLSAVLAVLVAAIALYSAVDATRRSRAAKRHVMVAADEQQPPAVLDVDVTAAPHEVHDDAADDDAVGVDGAELDADAEDQDSTGDDETAPAADDEEPGGEEVEEP